MMQMPTAAFTTLGCKVNQYETQKIMEDFEAHGFHIVPFDQPAEVYLINSCSVTHHAEAKSRALLRKALTNNPQAIIIATGCAAQLAINNNIEILGASVVVPNEHKLNAFSWLAKSYPQYANLNANPCINQSAKPSSRTRAVVKIQDGCNLFCSYCSIPYTRSKLVSRPWRDILHEVNDLANKGFKEIVLTGILLGGYDSATGSGGMDLVDLLRALVNIDGIKRIRLSSIETVQVKSRLIGLMASERKICPHLHIPLQSGDDDILSAMNRPYTRNEYIRLCQTAYQAIPNLAITTDIMVGFPGETDTAFNNTLDVVKQVGFARSHIFRFSPRLSTPAYNMKQVDERIKTERALILAELCAETQNTYMERYVGSTMEVLPETRSSKTGKLKGHTSNYLEIEFTAGDEYINHLTQVNIKQLSENCLIGELAYIP